LIQRGTQEVHHLQRVPHTKIERKICLLITEFRDFKIWGNHISVDEALKHLK